MELLLVGPLSLFFITIVHAEHFINAGFGAHAVEYVVCIETRSSKHDVATARNTGHVCCYLMPHQAYLATSQLTSHSLQHFLVYVSNTARLSTAVGVSLHPDSPMAMCNISVVLAHAWSY